MLRFHTARIAITSLLAVAIATQPMVRLQASESCADRAGSSDCASCGCCEVANTKTRCGCCGSAESNDRHTACDQQPESIAAAATTNGSEPHAAALRSRGCTCQFSPAPIREGRQHSRSIEAPVRHDLAVEADAWCDQPHCFASRRRPVRLDARGNQDHFSQHVLGVWLN